MLKIGLVGFGFMGRMHFDNYVRLMNEGQQIELVAICDLIIDELKDSKAGGNMSTGQEVYDLSAYRLYDNIEKMVAAEELDMIDLAVPTYIHAEMACSLLERGYHVFCEKPMARYSADARKMAETARKHDRKLMIGQCLRFWPGYEYLKATIEEERFGKVTAGYFYRGSEAPKNWFLDQSLSGGALLDMHIHDSDMIQWLFGTPEKVSTIGRNVIPGSGYDIASTHYAYLDGKVINSQVDWTLEGDHGFYMGYRVNFERGNIVFDGGTVTVNPNDQPGFKAELPAEDGYYRELKHFIGAIENNAEIVICAPESAADSVALVEGEEQSAKAGGAWVNL